MNGPTKYNQLLWLLPVVALAAMPNPIYLAGLLKPAAAGGGAAFVHDTFTDASGIDLTTHTGETGATWSKVTGFSGGIYIITNAAKCHAGGQSFYVASGTPATAEYDIEVDLLQISAVDEIAICARASSASNHCYRLYYDHPDGELHIELVSPTTTNILVSIDIEQPDFVTITNLVFEIRDASKRALTNGVQAMTTTDNTLTRAGLVGIYGNNTDWGTNTTGRRILTFTATNP